MIGLTVREAECMAVLYEAWDLDAPMPSNSEIAEALGLASKSGVQRLLNSLQSKNYIHRLPKRARAIEIIEAHICPKCGHSSSPGITPGENPGTGKPPIPSEASAGDFHSSDGAR